jgi:Ca2+-binding EF-hand superfamily protein
MKSPNLDEASQRTNWFSYFSTLRTYWNFRDLDTDKNGMISKQEMSKFKKGVYTDLFLDRLYQETQTYQNEMDFTGFLDFILAIENPSHKTSIGYLFKLLDIQNQGYLDEFTLRCLLQAIMNKLSAAKIDLVPIEECLVEIFDMAGAHDKRITLKSISDLTKDLIECGLGSTIVSILSDFIAFHAYENRDSEPKQ